MTRRIVAATVLVLSAVALALLFWPQLVGIQRSTPVAQAISFRTVALLGAAALAVVLLVVIAAARRARRFAASLLLVVAVFAGAQTAVLATRGWGGSNASAAGDVTVLVWNTLGDEPGVDAIARLAIAERADIVSLPETSEATATAVAAAMARAGLPMRVHNRYFDRIAKARTTSLLIAERLGRYRLDLSAGSTRTLPSGVWRPVDGTGPVIVAAHPVAPVPGEMSAWRDGLRWIADACASPDVIAAGDLNSTLDHWSGLGRDGGDLGVCRDAARATGAGAMGTWPADLPPALGAPIDHVMAGPAWRIRSFRVIETEDASGSDHRPVVARLTR